ncbi:hypothetical protein HG530_012700 [Fusarium avenaceum]|nr:hypothetical protein HG530_012700 [Fusarium avenaceum]
MTTSQTTVTSLLDSDRLGQVTREINVETLKNGEPVGNELKRDDVEETLKNVDGLGDLDLLGLGRLELLIVGVADDDGLTTTSNNLLVGVEGLLEEVITGEDHDDGEVLINQGQDTVLQLTRHDSLAVKVGNFLNLEGTLESSGELATTAEKEQRLLVLEVLAELLDGGVKLKDMLDLSRDSEHDHGNELRGVSLGRGDTDLRTGVNVDTTVGEERDGGTDDVDDTDGQGTTLQAVAESHEGVSSLTRLGDEDTGVVTEDRGLSIKEIGSQLNGDGDLSELLKDTTDSHARVVRCTASNEYDAAASTNGGDVRTETTKGDGLVGDVETATHGVDNGLGLLENLLLHEVVKLTLHDLLELKLKGLDGSDVGAAIGLLEAVDVEGALVDVSNVIILKVHDLLGVLDNSRGVGGEEELSGHGHAIIGHEGTRLRAVEEGLVGGTKKARVGSEKVVLLDGDILGSSLGGEGGVLVRVLNIDEVNLHAALGLDTDNERRTLSGGDDLMGVVDRLDEKTVSTLELLDDSLGKVGEANGRVLVVDVLGELGNALSVGLGLELEALGLEESLQLLVVDLLEVGVGLVNELSELGDLANLLEGVDLLLLVTVDG